MKLEQSLKVFQDGMAVRFFGRTRTEAHEKNICVSCGESITEIVMSDLDIKEWKISALCPKCFPEG